MSEPIDFDKKRKERQAQLDDGGADLYFCECGSSMFHCWTDGIVECLNCGAAIMGLEVVETD